MKFLIEKRKSIFIGILFFSIILITGVQEYSINKLLDGEVELMRQVFDSNERILELEERVNFLEYEMKK